MPSQELLDELKIIMIEDYGFELGPQELLDTANALVGLFEILAENINKDNRA